MKAQIGFLVWLTRRRVRASWRLLLVPFAAVLLGTTIISATVLYTDTFAERGLQHALRSSPQDTLNAQLIISERPLGEREYRKLQVSVERAVNSRLSPFLLDQARYGRTDTFQIVETALNRPALQGYTFFLTGFEEHSALVEGRWPRAAATGQQSDAKLPMEIAIGQDLARRMRWSLGLELAIWPSGIDRSEAVFLHVVGIVAPKNPTDVFWLGSLDLFKLIESDTGNFVPLYLSETDFFGGMGARFPVMPGDFWWRLYLDSQGLTSGQVKPVTDGLQGLETDINKLFPRSLLSTSLDTRLQEYQRRLGLAKVPIYLFSTMIVAVLLYYLWVVSSLLARSRGPELALLRSRGASLAQTVLVMGGAEGLMLVLPAVVIGPVLAFLLVCFPLNDSLFTGQGPEVMPGFSAGAFGLSALVGLLAIVVLSLSSLVAARGDVMGAVRQRSRPSSTLALHRSYVDVFLLLVLGVVWWQLRDRGGFITSRLLGEGVNVSPFTLIGPAVGLLAAALLMLRLFPLAMRILARAAERLGTPWLLHGLRRVARDANLYGALCLLLTLAIALGVFGAVFSATLQDARTSQALYKVGGDVVVQVPFALSAEQVTGNKSGIADVPGVEVATLVRRAQGSLAKGGQSMPVAMLAVQPATFAETAWYRRDFSPRSLESLLGPLSLPGLQQAGVPLPEGSRSVTVHARPNKAYAGLNLWAHVADANGVTRSLFVGELATADWRFLGAELPNDQNLAPPFRVMGFFMTTGLRGNIGSGELLLDDLGVVTPAGRTQVVENFDRPFQWTTFPHRGASEDTAKQVGPSQARSGGALAFTWTSPIGQDARGIFQSVVPTPLPVIAGPPFKEGDVLLVAVNRVLIPVRVEGAASFFPTLDPRRGSFIVVNLEHYVRYANGMPFGAAEPANELWLSLQPGVDRDATVAAVRKALPPFASLSDREAEAEVAEQDPLTAGGWRSLVLLGLLGLVGATVLGFTLFAVLSVQTGQVELAVLEAIGFSRMNIFLLVSLEFAVVGAIGLAAGIGIGLWTGRWALDYLAAQGITQASLPPVVLGFDVGLGGVAVAGAVAAAVLAAFLALLAVWHMNASAVLRGEG